MLITLVSTKITFNCYVLKYKMLNQCLLEGIRNIELNPPPVILVLMKIFNHSIIFESLPYVRYYSQEAYILVKVIGNKIHIFQ